MAVVLVKVDRNVRKWYFRKISSWTRQKLDFFAMESDDSERQKKLEAGKEKVRIQLCDVAERAKFINYSR